MVKLSLFRGTPCHFKWLVGHGIIVIWLWNIRIIKRIDWKLWFTSFISILHPILSSDSKRSPIQIINCAKYIYKVYFFSCRLLIYAVVVVHDFHPCRSTRRSNTWLASFDIFYTGLLRRLHNGKILSSLRVGYLRVGIDNLYRVVLELPKYLHS